MVSTAEQIAGRTAIVVEVRHRDPLLKLGVVATLREDVRFAVQADNGAAPGAMDADVVVTDYDTGIALAALPCRRDRTPRVMIVTQRDGETDVRQALSHGVLGYVVMGCRLDEITDCAMAVHRGQRYLTQMAAQRIAEHLLHQSLTPREIEVLHCVAGGWSNKMVGNHLGVGVGTVKAHLKGIFGKLDVRTRTEAAHVAQRRGLLTGVSAQVSYRSASPAQRGAGAGASALS